MAQEQVLGLDIGTSAVKAVIGEPVGVDKIKLYTGFSRPSRGMRKGVVVDMEEVAGAVTSVLQDVKSYSKAALRNIYLGVSGADVRAQMSRGIVAVARASSEIYKDDVARAIQASEAVNLPSNRILLHTVTREYIVDGIGDIRDPLGMVGARLEVVSVVIDAFQPAVKNLMKCVELSGGSVSGIIFTPLASAMAVLTRNQKELGVVLIDIGYGTTGIAVYEENKLLHAKTFPVGAGHITNDLAIALKIPVEAAEKLKLSYGYALAKDVPGKDTIDLSKIDPELKGAPTKKFVSEVIEARLAEICDLINTELRLIGKAAKLPAGVVVVGGGAKMPGMAELLRSELKLSSQVGLPQPSIFQPTSAATSELIESPEAAAALGLLGWSGEVDQKIPSLDGGVITKFIKSILP
ncbi:MAG: cell division protein FtsA [Patescibacteria group bacterium]|nr:cell division protein FtsA [Patescibacteria group bacterium]MCL5224361.1 cell division protein FtsA [Patescibacteria group bacterium]